MIEWERYEKPKKTGGASPEQEKELDAIRKNVERLSERLAGDGIDASRFPDDRRELLYTFSAKQLGLSEAAGKVAYLTRPGTKGAFQLEHGQPEPKRHAPTYTPSERALRRVEGKR